MDATTTEPITSLITRLIKNNEQHAKSANLKFSASHYFGWDYAACTITYNPDDPDAPAHLLHEYGHALLGHHDHDRDISLLAMERAAWDEAVQLAPKYNVTIDTDTIESALDTYRDWLHARSTCPTCATTGIQVRGDRYLCLACQAIWRVNDARSCSLRRYTIK